MELMQEELKDTHKLHYEELESKIKTLQLEKEELIEKLDQEKKAQKIFQ